MMSTKRKTKEEPDIEGGLVQPDEWDDEKEELLRTLTREEPERKRQKMERAPRFDELKSFKGKRYTGMAIGGSHHWTYDSGQWDETKEEPDLWNIEFEARKHRQRHAPKGSGVPVGTEYHWLIVAHQVSWASSRRRTVSIHSYEDEYVVKEDQDTYATRMQGRKYKLAHKSVGSNAWRINTVKGQREREIALLEDAKARVQGLAPVIGSQKVATPKRKERGQRTLEQTFMGGVRKKAEPEESEADIDSISDESE